MLLQSYEIPQFKKLEESRVSDETCASPIGATARMSQSHTERLIHC